MSQPSRNKNHNTVPKVPITITYGMGSGPTEIAAFDNALVEAGVANYNLIYLSSVLPPNSSVSENQKPQIQGEWGDRLYVVMAQKRTSQPNQQVWAGIGWIQDEADGRGLLVEHEGYTEAEVRWDIENSLDALARHRRRSFGPQHMVVSGATCSGLPVCSLVIAVFEAEPWLAASPKQT